MFELKPEKFTKITQHKKENRLIIHSFTLFSAIVSNYIKLFGKEDFNQNKNFFEEINLTSAFPKIDKVFFFPYPKGKRLFKVDDLENRTLLKKLKKLSFIDFKTFKEWLETGKEEEAIKLKEDNIKKEFYTEEEIEVPAKKTLELKTLVYRRPLIRNGEIKNNELFERDVIIFDEKFSFYFLIEVPEKIEDKIKRTILNLEGIGGKRSSGCGHFKVKEINNKEIIELLGNKKNEGILLNSVPATNELEPEHYLIVEYGGYFDITSKFPNKLKPQLFYLDEGSFVKLKENIKNKEIKLKVSKVSNKREEFNELFIYKRPWVV